MNQDETHLDNLSIAHYVVGGIMILFSCFPLIYVVIGLMFALDDPSMFPESEKAPPPLFGWMFFIVGVIFFLMGQALSISVLLSGRFISKRKNYLFSFILACLACLFVPFGTILGIFTIIVLSKDSVKALYGKT